jgi:HK97 family phage prohead protease
MNDIERRFTSLETTITRNKLGGYAVVYNQSTDLGPFLERIAPTAFRSVLASPDLDVRGLLNHNPDLLLARTPHTLRLSTDSSGLEFELDLPDTTVGRDVREMVDAKLITGCSFGFIPDGQDWSTQDGRDLRTHTSVGRLLDVSVVTYPAYQGTSVSLRSKPTSTTPIDIRTQIALAKVRAHQPRGN